MAVRIKICGITNEADALLAAELGADAIGLNFYPQSPRCIDAAVAAAVVQILPPFVEPIGLFVNRPLAEAAALLRPLERIRTIQWHGDEPEPKAVPPFRLIPAFRIQDAASLRAVERFLGSCREASCQPAAVLVDAHVAGQYGGTGRTAPWQLLADFRPGVPLILAGGLTPENVAEAVRLVRPYAVDVASGVESAPGRKDREKLCRFFDAVRAAC